MARSAADSANRGQMPVAQNEIGFQGPGFLESRFWQKEERYFGISKHRANFFILCECECNMAISLNKVFSAQGGHRRASVKNIEPPPPRPAFKAAWSKKTFTTPGPGESRFALTLQPAGRPPCTRRSPGWPKARPPWRPIRPPGAVLRQEPHRLPGVPRG